MENQAPRKLTEELQGSLEKILAFSGCGEKTADSFRLEIAAYKNLKDKNSSDEKTARLRYSLTSDFYKVYEAALLTTIKTGRLPFVIRMLLNFGYVDEELAGIDNTMSLFRMLQNMPTDPSRGVYSFHQWLVAIYNGQKEPSRNELDMDYEEYLKEQKKMGRISSAQETGLLSSTASKVIFEIKNALPNAGKMLSGRPNNFCPVFSRHNLAKPLDQLIVSADRVQNAIDDIRRIDYGVFFRDITYTNSERGISNELIKLEVLPDIVLLPSFGLGSVMWQEIEGKKRDTPARMMLPFFMGDDLSSAMLTMAGQFRWEMCKRVHGGKWNSPLEPSLTGKYYDYAQFYQQNPNLSADAKDKIKTQLSYSRNNYKDMFVSDYITWIKYESKGAPRLNKVVREIMAIYCPLSAE